MKNRPNYEILSTELYEKIERYDSKVFFKIKFLVDVNEYVAFCTYKNGNLLDGYCIQDYYGVDVDDESIVHLGCDLLDNMETNKNQLI